MVGKIKYLFYTGAIALLCANLLLPISASATIDTTPPSLTHLSFSSTTVDVTQGEQTINFELHASDADSGVKNVALRLFKPAGKSGDDVAAVWTSTGPSVWQGTLSFKQYIASGDWIVNLDIEDNAGNYTIYEGQQLVDAGYPGFINVVSNEDQTKPAVTVVDLDQQNVDVTSGPQTVGVTVTASDDISGVQAVAAIFSPPGGGASDIMVFFTIISNSNGSEQWSGIVQFPQYIRNGTWEMRIIVADKAGNILSLNSDQLAAQGFDGAVAVTSDQDDDVPVLTDFNFDVDSVNTSSSDQTVTANLTANDTKAGVGVVNIALVSPSGSSSGTIWPSYASRVVSGQTTTWTATYTIPQGSETGNWTVVMYVADKVGNYFEMDSTQLAVAGHDSSVMVSNDSGGQAARTQSYYGELPDEENEELETLVNGLATEGLKLFYATNNSLIPVETAVELLFPVDTTEPTYPLTRL